MEVITFSTGKPGNHLLVLGRIHGDEPCGTNSIKRLEAEIASGKISPTCGHLTMIPCCNPRAGAVNRRFLDKNLNRIFRRHTPAVAYEERLANTLIELIETPRKPDFILDLHSFNAGGPSAPSFAMRVDSHPLISRIVGRLPITYCLNGWREIQTAFKRPEAYSTIDHALAIGVPAIGIECGQHVSELAKNAAYQSIREVMGELGICEPEKTQTASAPKNLYFKHVEISDGGGQFVNKWTGFEMVVKGQPIGRRKNNEVVCAPLDGRITLPNEKAPAGAEWFYITQE